MKFFLNCVLVIGLMGLSAVFAQPELYINEFMADNDNIISDPQGDYDDWIEIYNPIDADIDLEGFFLTDDLADPEQWAFPDTFIEAGGFLLIWADDDSGDAGLHTNFKLGASGEEIGLYSSSGEIIDTIIFGEQTTDISYGRMPDGEGTWQFFDVPTPGESNSGAPPNLPPVITDVDRWPRSPSSTDTVIVIATIWDDYGLDETLLKYDAGAGFVNVNLFDDGQHGDSAAGDSVFGGSIPPFANGTEVSYYLLATDDSSSETVFPPGAPGDPLEYIVMDEFTPPPVVVNEFLASNNSINTDPDFGEYEDWIELYNTGTEVVDLAGMFLTDDLSEPDKWEFPSSTLLLPGDYLIIWADNEDTVMTGIHTNFKLGAGGEQVGLFSTRETNTLPIDTLTFGEQKEDTSYGRVPDGSENWLFMSLPTPGSTNLSTPEQHHGAPSPTVLSLVGNYPNPFNPRTTIHYQLSRPAVVSVSIYNLMGKEVRAFYPGLQTSGVQEVHWDGRNHSGRQVASGIYLGQIYADVEHRNVKMILLR